MKIEYVSQHAIEKAVREFRVDQRVAEDWIRSNLRKAAFVADIVSDEGKPSRLFGFQRIAFVLDAVRDVVVTVYPRHHAVNELQTKINALLQRELRKAERRERATERAVRIEKARLAVERAECELKMELTPSAKVMTANKRRIFEIETRCAELDEELSQVKREKSALAKSIVAYL